MNNKIFIIMNLFIILIGLCSGSLCIFIKIKYIYNICLSLFLSCCIFGFSISGIRISGITLSLLIENKKKYGKWI